jgi:hypothetical protein
MATLGGGADHDFLSAPRPPARTGPAAAGVGQYPLTEPPTAAAAFVRQSARTPTLNARSRGEIGFAPEPTASSSAGAAGAPVRPRAIAVPTAEAFEVAAPTPVRIAELEQPAATASPPALPGTDRESRVRPWALAAWAFVRKGGTAALAPGGMLGGSQAGARGTYRVAGKARPLALSLRLSSPLEQPRGGEAAAGVDWKPLPSIPVHLLLERRQKLGSAGRSAFAVTAYGGGAVRLGPLQLDGYAQAGAVGIGRRDLFADGALRAGLPLGRLRLGAGAWGAAQPGVARLDVGPRVEARLRDAVSLSADWRWRIAGNARPGSGPALTLAADF